MIKAFAPATVANINCGFDVLGMAIEQPGDIVGVNFNTSKKIIVRKISGDNGKLPYETHLNTAAVAITSLCKHLKIKTGIDIYLHKQMPLGSGLGSSAASAVAAVVACNHLLGNKLNKTQLLPFVMDSEAVAGGSAHADNVAPSLLGGIILIRSYNPLDIISLPVPENLHCSVIHPNVEILTKEARNILPKQISMQNTLIQMGNIAGFVAGLASNNLALVSRSLIDVIAEPYRSALIPHFEKVKNAALYGGALGFGISGSGPAMFALSDGLSKAEQISELMYKTLSNKNIECQVFTSKVNTKGAYIL